MFCETERRPGWLNHGDRGATWKALVRQLASGQIIKGFLWHVKGVIVYFIFLRAVEVIGTVSAGETCLFLQLCGDCATYFIKVKVALIIISPLPFEMLKFEEKNNKKKRTRTILKSRQLIIRYIPISEVLRCEKNVHLRTREVQS